MAAASHLEVVLPIEFVHLFITHASDLVDGQVKLLLLFVECSKKKAGGRENSSQASSRFFRNRVFCSRQNQSPSWHDNIIDWQPINMFARNIGSASAREALRTGLRYFSGTRARSDTPRAWTPIPYITETIVCPTLFRAFPTNYTGRRLADL